MRFSITTALLLSSTTLTLASPIPDDANLDIGPDDVLDPNTIPIDVGATIIVGIPILLDLGTSPKTPLVQREPTTTDTFVELSARARSKDQQNALKLHNQARRAKGLSKLVWDKQLTADAMAWAQQLAKNNNGLQHSSNESRPGQGENLAYSYSSQPIERPASSGTKAWLAEEPNYKGENIPEGNFAGYGHYSESLSSQFLSMPPLAFATGRQLTLPYSSSMSLEGFRQGRHRRRF